MFKNKIISIFITTIIAFGLISCGQQPPAGAALKGEVLEKAPSFTLKDLDGNSFSLSDTAGKVVILDFFATWCPPCEAEIPHFEALYKKYKGNGLVIVGVSLDQTGVKTVKSFSAQHGVTYPMVMANKEVVANYGGIRAIPTTFILDREGRVVSKAVGFRPKEFFEDEIKKLL